MNIFINGFSSISKEGIISSQKGIIKFNDSETPLSISRKTVFSKLHTGFGKLNVPDKLAFSAAALVLDGLQDTNFENTGISLGSTTGSLSTDLRYMESIMDGFPSPAYFQATLPSSPVAEVAIMFKLKGPDRAIVKTKGAGLEALNSAIRLLEKKKAENVIVLFINGTDPIDENCKFIEDINISNPFAFSLLLSTNLNAYSKEITIKTNYNGNKNIQTDDEEAYFLNLIKSLYNSNSFNNTCSVNGITTEIQIKKDI